MKLTILQDNLKRGLNVINRISPKIFSLPVLSNLLLVSEKNFLNLVSTDLEIGINWWSLAKIEKEGKTTVPTKIFSNFVNLLPNKPINISAEGGFLRVECQNYKTKIKTFPTEDFPIIPKISDEKSISVDGVEFCQGLAQVVDIPQPSSARAEISGIYLLFQKNLIKIVATDSFRLGEKRVPLKKSTSDIALILPQKAAREIINIFGEAEGELKINFSPNQVMFESQMLETKHPRLQLVSRIIEGEYPNYEAIIPKGYKTLATVEKNDFLNQVKIASLFSGKINEVKLTFDPKKEEIEILSQSPELGEHQSSLASRMKGEKAEVSFNHRFLVEGLSNIKGNNLDLEINGEEGPAVLRSPISQNYIYIVMPIKAD